jgi:hypothetical protein
MNNRRILFELVSPNAAGRRIFALGVWDESTESWDTDQVQWSTNPFDLLKSYAEASPPELLLWRNRYANDRQKIEIDQYLDSL